MSSATSNPYSSKYKTEMCRNILDGKECPHKHCQFAHSFEELRRKRKPRNYKTELCHAYHSTGFCPYGVRCAFRHETPTNSPTNSPRQSFPMAGSNSSSLNPSNEIKNEVLSSHISLNSKMVPNLKSGDVISEEWKCPFVPHHRLCCFRKIAEADIYDSIDSNAFVENNILDQFKDIQMF